MEASVPKIVGHTSIAMQNVDDALLLVALGASRQVRRAQARRARKQAGSRGLTTTRLRILPEARKMLGIKGPRDFECHVITLTPFGAATERTFHFTKGHRQRRVAV